ncbi:fungal-specific transcription factor domain-containing protein [Colletotrichum phormii]|uniref:Fungal-specific transcription factor domain-containing protein n=1 Tax=Colletotrichum phormii TaxID=359342 RepID=A0AAJ0EKY8_9PEZI|nr:fungal-specific transcription factor domain-containing protein [Colletotrichum phormii]KAK1655067.1 fungal-specific transcription factor domain-containing protein [Colletotrichum phormii]
MLYKDSARSQTALLFMVFAHSNNYQKHAENLCSSSLLLSARFFAVAKHQLSMEKGEIRLAHIQARLAQCFYLLTQSRLNHCWTLFGITAQLAMALGIHRKSRVDPKTSDGLDYVNLECRKRTFWYAYNLNTYLSAALGRPMTFHDEDIDQESPLCVDDDQLHPGYGTRLTEGGSSLASAPVAQIKLSRIVARVLRSLYGIKSCSTEEHLAFATRFNRDLSEWRDLISYLLDTAGPSALDVKLVLRQRDVLQLAYWHAQILVHRPFLLKSLSSISDSGHEEGTEILRLRHEEIRMNLQLCVDAAIEITKHIHLINDAGELYSTLFVSYYSRLSMQRYGVVLQELRLEVLRNNTYLASVSTPRAGDWSTTKEINENQAASCQKP